MSILDVQDIKKTYTTRFGGNQVKALKGVSFTVEEGDYTATNLEQAATVTNEAGVELPSTGGMGTTIFYALGAVLVLGAGVMMVTKRRMAN